MSRRMPWPPRAGFTLVELLVVVIIIGILAALLIPTINAARNAARRATITLEMNQLSSALEQYKDKNGSDYPPDFSNPALVSAHLGRGFPRHDRAGTNVWLVAQNNPANATNGSWKIDPAEALVLWLSGVSKDTLRPLTSPTTSKTVYFDFRPERLKDIDGDGFSEYYPAGVETAPYVYFHNTTYALASYPNATVYAGHSAISGIGEARAYGERLAGTTMVWYGPRKFQIVTAGIDMDFGDPITLPTPGYKIAPGKGTPSGANLTKGDQDNLTTFSEGKTLEALQP